MPFIVVNIGCLECGVSSNIVGVFDDQARADAEAARCDKNFGWREGGQNSFEVFPMPEMNPVAEEYKAVAATEPTTTETPVAYVSGLTDSGEVV